MKANTKLTVKWSKREHDLMINWPRHKADVHFISRLLDVMREELHQRGYDITTLCISVDSIPEKK